MSFVADVSAALLSYYVGRIVEDCLQGPEGRVETIAVANHDAFTGPRAWPTVIHRGRRTAKALVLVHDVGASPARLWALAHALARARDDLSVVLPRLAADALPRRAEWRDAVEHAAWLGVRLGEEVSIGGVSSGAALAIDRALRAPQEIRGKLLLFSAMLDRTPFPGAPAWAGPFAGPGAEPPAVLDGVGRLGDAVAAAVAGAGQLASRGRVFVAHSAADPVVPLSAVLPLAADPTLRFVVPAHFGVGHLSLVEDPAAQGLPAPDSDGPPNPLFTEMARQAAAFLGEGAAEAADAGGPAAAGQAPEPETPPPEDVPEDPRAADTTGAPDASPVEDEYTRLLLDAQTATGSDPDEIRKVARFANKAKDFPR